MSRSFRDGLKTPFANLVKSYEVKDRDGVKHELSYLPWARALALAERPRQEVIHWAGVPYFEIFGGIVVGVTQHVLLENGRTVTQDTHLPVLDGASRPIPAMRADSRDISDTINRCRAKSAAMVSGVGLSLYSHANADTVNFILKLGVNPDSDLAQIEPLISKKDGKGAYVDWPSALAAARLTDPAFQWEIIWNECLDTKTGEIKRLPVLQAGTGWMVGVKTWYKGVTHIEYLPIMGMLEVATANGKKKLDHQPLLTPSTHDWNRAVMRCLVKAVSLVSGYGLSVYANEDVEKLHVEPLKATKPAAASVAEGTEQPQSPADDPKEVKRLAVELSGRLAATGKDVSGLMIWLGRPQAEEDFKLPPEEQLARLSIEELTRGLSAVNSKKGSTTSPSVH